MVGRGESERTLLSTAQPGMAGVGGEEGVSGEEGGGMMDERAEYERHAIRLVEQLRDSQADVARLQSLVDLFVLADGPCCEAHADSHQRELAEVRQRAACDVAEFSAQAAEERGRAILALRERDRAVGELAECKRRLDDLLATYRAAR